MTLDLDTLREGWDFEAKLAAGQSGRGAVPKDLWPTYSAMANASGGIVVLGARELSDGGLEITGIIDIDKVERDLWNQLTDLRKVSVNLLRQQDIERHVVDDKTILVLTIPRAARRQRPVFINNNPLTGSYLRVHEGDRQLGESEVRRLLADADPERPRDSQALPRFTTQDLDPETLKAYRNTLRSHNASHPYLASDDVELLRRAGGLVRDRDTGEDALTQAGLLMFGRDETIREHMPTFHLDYREVDEAAAKSGTRWTDRVVPDGTWPGNVFEFYRRVQPKLTAGLKVPFQLAPDLLRQGETPVHLALKEALVNALIHSEHGGKGGVRVFRHGDRFEFINPGTLLLPPEQVRQGGMSECRNATIQTMFRIAGIGEKAGSGFPQILSAWQEQHWRAPLLEEGFEHGQTRLVLSMLDLFPAGTVQTLKKQLGQRFDELPYSGRLALATAATEARVSNQRLQELTTEHAHDLTTMLRDLVRRGLLAPHGKGTGRWYTLARSIQSTGPSLAEQSEQSFEQSSEQRQISFVNNKNTLEKIAASKWTPRSEIAQAVLDLCRERALTLEEIARAIGRSPTTVRVHYTGPLVKAGRLHVTRRRQSGQKEPLYRTSIEQEPDSGG